MNSFEKFNEAKLPAKKYFYISTKDGKITDDGPIKALYIEHYINLFQVLNHLFNSYMYCKAYVTSTKPHKFLMNHGSEVHLFAVYSIHSNLP